MATIRNVIETLFVAKGARATAAATENVTKAQTRLGQTSASAGRQFSSQSAGLGGLVAAYAGAAANIFAITQAFAALSRAARAEQTIAGVRTLAAEVGQNGDQIIAKLREITQGQISLAETATSANLALSAGFSSKQIEGLAIVATKASKALGRDLTDSLNRLTRGAAKVEPEILDELGIIVRLDKAVESYALKVGKAVSSLSVFERSQAFTNAIIEQGIDKFSAIDETADTTIRTFEQLSAAVVDLATQIGGIIASALGPFVQFLTGNFLNTLSTVGLLGGLVFSKLGTVATEGLNKIATSAESVGTTVTNALGKGGAARAATALTKETSKLNFDAKSLTGQFIGLSAQSRRTAISLLAKSKTTQLTAQELIKLRNALQGATFATTEYEKVVNAATGSTARLGFAARAASATFGFAAKGIGLLAKGFGGLISIVGRAFFIISILQLLSSTIGKLVFGVDLFATAGEKLKGFFENYRQDAKIAADASLLLANSILAIPEAANVALPPLEQVSIKTKSYLDRIFGGGTEVTGEEAVTAIRERADPILIALRKFNQDLQKVGTIELGFQGQALKRDSSLRQLTDSLLKNLDPDSAKRANQAITKFTTNFYETYRKELKNGGKEITPEIRDAFISTITEALGQVVIADTAGNAAAAEVAQTLLASAKLGLENAAAPAQEELTAFFRNLLKGGLTRVRVEELFDTGTLVQSGKIAFSSVVKGFQETLTDSKAAASISDALGQTIDLKGIPDEAQQDLGALFNLIAKYAQQVGNGTITTETFNKAVAAQDDVLARLLDRLGDGVEFTSDFERQVLILIRSIKASRPAVEAYAKTFDFLQKNFDIKGFAQFGKFVDGTGKLATTSRQIKENPIRQLGALIERLGSSKNGQATEVYKQAVAAISARYEEIVNSLDSLEKSNDKLGRQLNDQLTTLDLQIANLKDQAALNKLLNDRKVREASLKAEVDANTRITNEAKGQLDLQKAIAENQKLSLENKEAELDFASKLRDIEFERNKLEVERAAQEARRRNEFTGNLQSSLPNLFSDRQRQELGLDNLRIDVTEARELLALTREREAKFIADQKVLLEQRQQIIETEKRLAIQALINDDVASARREAQLDEERAFQQSLLAANGGINKEFNLRQDIIKREEEIAQIRIEAADVDRQITVEKIAADAQFIAYQAKILAEHPERLVDVFNGHISGLAKVFTDVEGRQINASPIQNRPEEVQNTLKDISERATIQLGVAARIAEDGRRLTEKERASLRANTEERLKQLGREKTEAQNAALERIKEINAQIDSEIILRQTISEKIKLEEQRAGILSEQEQKKFELELENSKDRQTSAERALENAKLTLKTQEDLNEILNNDFVRVLDRVAGIINNNLKKGADDFFDALNAGTLTMNSFKEGARNLLLDTLKETQKAMFEEFFLKDIQSGISEFFGGFLDDLTGARGEQAAALESLATGLSKSNEGLADKLESAFGNVQNVRIVAGQAGLAVQVTGSLGGAAGGAVGGLAGAGTKFFDNFDTPSTGIVEKVFDEKDQFFADAEAGYEDSAEAYLNFADKVDTSNQGMLGSLGSGLEDFGSKALGVFGGLGKGLSSVFEGVFDGIGSIFSGIFGGAGGGGGGGGIFGSLLGGIGSLFGGGAGGGLFSGVGNFFTEAFTPSLAFGDLAMSGLLINSGGLVTSHGALGRLSSFNHFAAGGLQRDRVPALLEPGEFVLRKSAVDSMGVPAAEMLNATGRANAMNNKPTKVMIENSGSDKEASESTFDPESAVLKIVLKDLATNGPIRKSIRSNT